MSQMDEKENASLERGAADDITRMRWRLKIRENIIGRLVAENQRLRNGAVKSCETVCPHVRGTVTQHCSLNFTLTDEERDALEAAIAWMAPVGNYDFRLRTTLQSLLKRMA
jgi:hypothetical protein